MTKLRAPDSVEDACRQAAALLGDEVISMALKAIGLQCSPSLIAKWSDPDAPHTPSIDQALAIDKLLSKAQHDLVFGRLFDALKAAAVPDLQEELRPLAAAARVVCSAAEVLEQIEKAEDDGQIEPFELIGLLAALDRVQKRVAPLRRSLFARVRRSGTKLPAELTREAGKRRRR